MTPFPFNLLLLPPGKWRYTSAQHKVRRVDNKKPKMVVACIFLAKKRVTLQAKVSLNVEVLRCGVYQMRFEIFDYLVG